MRKPSWLLIDRKEVVVILDDKYMAPEDQYYTRDADWSVYGSEHEEYFNTCYRHYYSDLDESVLIFFNLDKVIPNMAEVITTAKDNIEVEDDGDYGEDD